MEVIDKLYRIALENSNLIKDYRKRYLYASIHGILRSSSKGKKPIVILSGIRGIGKTTLMLQLFSNSEHAFYFSADSIIVRTSSIYSIVEEAQKQGYTAIFIDEIHKYPRWIEELKNIYDDFNLNIVVSGSSTAALKKGSILLGRRAINIPLLPLTFAEFFYLNEGKEYTATIGDVLDKKNTLKWLADHPDVEASYKEYLLHGGFPLRIEDDSIVFRLVKRMIYEDALAEFSLTKNKVDIAERMLGFLSVSTPGEFSYTSFSSMSGYSKSTVYESVILLTELEILRIVEEENPKSKVKKTIKLLFSHPNLRAAFSGQLMQEPGVGAMREEYFLFHMAYLGLPVFIPKKGRKFPDYEVVLSTGRLLFEIGGSSKTSKQFMGQTGVVIDDERLIVLGFVNHVQKTDQK